MMPERTSEKIDQILAKIGEIWKNNPELRLMQLLGNAIPLEDPYYIRDCELIDYLKDFYNDKIAS